jgi:inner membrane protein
MPTVLSHPAVALGLRLGAGARAVPDRLLVLAAACSVVPDLDAVGFWLGVPYGHPLGHRGISHSILFALMLGWLASRWSEQLRASRFTAFVIVAASTASHGVLDALTSGGLGVAFFSPFSNARLFFPWRPIAVSPISVFGFFEARSVWVMASELLWIWLPAVTLGLLAGLLRRARRAA